MQENIGAAVRGQMAVVLTTALIAAGAIGAAVAQDLPEGVEPVSPLLAEADIEAGEREFRRCQACHTADEGGANKVGPNLWGVVGRDIASVPDYDYSDALASLEGDWDYERLNAFIHDPRGYVPGTKMIFPGLKDVQDRANLIAWLRMQADEPAPLPEE